ncbi:MAG: hypothetical protein H7Z71_08530 [Moraxellaceae bacterium]|nr:hypothetical protein [Pseudobdellovibrionaceae bacterium]
MKKIRFNFVLLMTVISTLLVACQPKDVTIKKPFDDKAKIKDDGANTVENNKLLAITLDRQFEPLYVLKAVLNPQYAAVQGLETTFEPTTQVLTLSAVNKMKTFDTPAFSSEYSLKYDIKSLVKDTQGRLTSLILKSKVNEMIQSVGYVKTGKKDDAGNLIVTNFTSQAASEIIMIQVTQTPGFYTVEVSRTEDTNSTADKKNLIATSIVSTIEWDGTAAGLDNEIATKLNALKVDRVGAKTTTLKYDEIVAALPVRVKIGTCVSASGSVTLVQRVMAQGADKMAPPTITNTIVELNDSSLKIDKFSSEAKECATRPVVDLTRML